MPVPGTTAERGALTSDFGNSTSYLQQPAYQQSEDDRRLAEKICKRQSMLEDQRALTDSVWDLIDEIGTARRAVWDLGEMRGALVGQKLGEKVYDGTMAQAGQDLADGLQGQTAIKGLVWWAAHLRNKTAQKDYIAKTWIDDVQDCTQTEMLQSDFYAQDNEACQDAVFMGTATMDKPIWLFESGRMHYQTRHPREIFIWRDDNGIICGRHRKFPMTLRNIADKFGTDRLDLKMRQQVETNPFSTRMVLHAMYLNTERDTSKWTAQNKRIASVYLIESEKLILRKSGFDDWPQVSWCWRLNSQETYGRGPAMDTVFESATLNAAAHYLLDALQMGVQKPLVADEALKGKIKIGPNAVTWVTGNEGASIRELYRQSSEYAMGYEEIAKMRDELRDKFKAKTFQLLTYLTQQTERMNMMQIAEIKGEKASLLGPIVGNRESDLLCPMISSTVALLIKRGKAPAPPLSMMRYMNTPMDYEFLGPIAVALKRYVQTQGLAPFMSRLMGEKSLLDVWPEMRDRLDPDALYDTYFEADGAPTKVDRDPDTLMKIRKQIAQKKAEAEKMAKAKEMAGAYKQTTDAPQEGSPAQAAMDQQGGGQ